MNKTSKADFDFFKDRVAFEVARFGLTDWKIHLEHTNNHTDSYAYIQPPKNIDDRMVTIGLTIDWGDSKVNKKHLEYCARHEVLHLLLMKLVSVGQSRQSTDQDFVEAQHAIIYRLETVLGD